MRFFTLEWWCGIQDGDIADDPSERYRFYLATIRERLPAGFWALQESVSLHDGRLRELEILPSEGTLLMAVDGDDGSGGKRRFVLRYSGVTLFRSMADPTKGLPGPRGYGDWGYDEADITPEGTFEHRIVFSSGIEILVQFAGFELS